MGVEVYFGVHFGVVFSKGLRDEDLADRLDPLIEPGAGVRIQGWGVSVLGFGVRNVSMNLSGPGRHLSGISDRTRLDCWANPKPTPKCAIESNAVALPHDNM